MIAQQAAMMDRMFADMDTLLATAMPDPDQMIRSVMQGIPPGSDVVVTSFSTGNGDTCSQTIHQWLPGQWRAAAGQGQQHRQRVWCDWVRRPGWRDADAAHAAARRSRAGRAAAWSAVDDQLSAASGDHRHAAAHLRARMNL